MNDRPPEHAKQFGLKPVEFRSLQGIHHLYLQQISLFLSFIALERLAYPVGDRTQFRTEGDKLFIWELEEGPASDETAVSTGDAPTADAMKKGKK